jgi:hypothetical protein
MSRAVAYDTGIPARSEKPQIGFPPARDQLSARIGLCVPPDNRTPVIMLCPGQTPGELRILRGASRLAIAAMAKTKRVSPSGRSLAPRVTRDRRTRSPRPSSRNLRGRRTAGGAPQAGPPPSEAFYFGGCRRERHPGPGPRAAFSSPDAPAGLLGTGTLFLPGCSTVAEQPFRLTEVTESLDNSGSSKRSYARIRIVPLEG